MAAVDHHCHPLLKARHPQTPQDLRRAFTEATDPDVIELHSQHLVAYRSALRRIAAVIGSEASEEAVVAALKETDPDSLIAQSRTGLLILDHGYAGGDAMSPEEHASTIHIPQRAVVRLENLAEELIPDVDSVAGWLESVGAELQARVRAGAVGVKTIAAYRSGLRLGVPDRSRVEADFARLKAGSHGSARVRLEGEPLCHTLLLEAAATCASLGVPLQVHCGFGDPDEDLALSSPLGLRPIFLEPRFAGLSVVLLHCYPYHREAAYLASVFPGVYMDLSLAIPMAAHDGARAMTEALGLCPISKLLYATDASRYAEVYLVAAALHREALAGALARLVEGGWLSRDEAVQAGRDVLDLNARRLYRLD